MNPIEFKESNKDLIKPKDMMDKECGSLPVYTDGEQCISCWKLSLKEKINILLFGKVWLSVMSGSTQAHVWLMAGNSIFIEDTKE